ncbi:MAG: TonB family protein [Bacteroidetes bacterium]|nr:TonB family protein [Bacteroidota bacterium]
MASGCKRFVVLFGLILIPVLTSFGQTQFGRISGKVIDQATNNGVAFVTVYLYLGESQKLSARSNSGGNFSFVNVVPDVYTIRTSKPNYLEYSKQVRVNPNFTTKLYIPLSAMGEGSANKPPQIADNVVDQPAKNQTEIVKTSAPVTVPVVNNPVITEPVAVKQDKAPEIQQPAQQVTSPAEVSTASIPVAEAAVQEMEAIAVQDDDQKIWEATEISPEIDGGFGNVYKILKYPEVAVIQKVEGTVVCRVYIDKEGNPINTEVLRSIHPAIDKAAQDALFNVKYIPGKQNGVVVSTMLTVPIKFKLSK